LRGYRSKKLYRISRAIYFTINKNKKHV